MKLAVIGVGHRAGRGAWRRRKLIAAFLFGIERHRPAHVRRSRGAAADGRAAGELHSVQAGAGDRPAYGAAGRLTGSVVIAILIAS